MARIEWAIWANEQGVASAATTSLIYLRAAIANEKWQQCNKVAVKKEGGKSIKRLRPPSMAPPRMKQARENKAAEYDEGANKV
eukprot:gene1886-16384_t